MIPTLLFVGNNAATGDVAATVDNEFKPFNSLFGGNKAATGGDVMAADDWDEFKPFSSRWRLLKKPLEPRLADGDDDAAEARLCCCRCW